MSDRRRVFDVEDPFAPDGDTHYHMHDIESGRCYGDFIFERDARGSLVPGRHIVALPYCTTNPECKPDLFFGFEWRDSRCPVETTS